MGIFKKAYTAVLFLAIFLAGMFISVDFTPTTGFVDIGAFEVAEAETNDTTGKNNPNGVTQTPPADSNNETQKTFDSLIVGLNNALVIITGLVTPLIMFAGWLMSPDWVTGDIFGLRQKMYDLWMTVSNILYFIYAIFLIVIAIATIFNSKAYGYRTMLPRLFIGIALIPMTWWFVQFIVSTSTMITATVLNIPGELVKKTTTDGGWWESPTIPKDITFSQSKTPTQTLKEICSTTPSDTTTTSGGQNGANTKCISPRDFISTGGGMYSPLLIYGYGIFKIQDVDKIPQNGAAAIDILKNVAQLVNGMVFSVIMLLVFGILVIALVFILFVRAIKLWMYAIFSPLFSLKFVFRDQWKDKTSEMFSIKEFIGLAFVPAVIGLALSFGLIVAATISQGIGKTMSEQDPCDMLTQECDLMSNIMGNPNNKITQHLTLVSKDSDYKSVTRVYIGGITMHFEGTLDKSAPTEIQKGGTFLGAFATIIVQFIALVFIWIAFMAATKINNGVAALMEPFESFGNQLKEMGKNSVKHIPLPIVGNGYGLTQVPMELRTRSEAKMKNDYAKSTVGKAFNAPYTSHKLELAIRQSVNIMSDHSKPVEADARRNGKEMTSVTKTMTTDAGFEGNIRAQRIKMKEILNTWANAIKDKDLQIMALQSMGFEPGTNLYKAIEQDGINGLNTYLSNASDEEFKKVMKIITDSTGTAQIKHKPKPKPGGGGGNKPGGSATGGSATGGSATGG